jgi:broad specificity phosphatase PhoE
MSIVKIVRHSKADDRGRLTQEGIDKAKEYGRTLKKNNPGYEIVARSSNTERARNTAELIMQEAGTDYDPRQTVDSRLNLSYSREEIEKISGYPSHLEGALQEAQAVLYNDIFSAAKFADEHAAESTSNVVYIGVTHSPTLEGIAYFVTNNEDLKKKPDNLEGFMIEKGYWIPDRALENKIPCTLVGICSEAFKKLK